MEVIRTLKDGGMRTKSGIMLGLGEEKEEVIQTLKDLSENGCDVVTIGHIFNPQKNIYRFTVLCIPTSLQNIVK
jgi:lipoic acid synthetase